MTWRVLAVKVRTSGCNVELYLERLFGLVFADQWYKAKPHCITKVMLVISTSVSQESPGLGNFCFRPICSPMDTYSKYKIKTNSSWPCFWGLLCSICFTSSVVFPWCIAVHQRCISAFRTVHGRAVETKIPSLRLHLSLCVKRVGCSITIAYNIWIYIYYDHVKNLNDENKTKRIRKLNETRRIK